MPRHSLGGSPNMDMPSARGLAPGGASARRVNWGRWTRCPLSLSRRDGVLLSSRADGGRYRYPYWCRCRCQVPPVVPPVVPVPVPVPVVVTHTENNQSRRPFSSFTRPSHTPRDRTPEERRGERTPTDREAAGGRRRIALPAGPPEKLDPPLKTCSSEAPWSTSCGRGP